jgi:transposase
VTALRERVAMVEAQFRAVRAERDRLAGEVEQLRVDNQRLQTRVGELAAQVEELRRAGKRQAAPFSKNTPTPYPRRPGRKAGAAYGRHGRRSVPDRVDRQITVRFPATCPTCGGQVAFERVADQYQQDLPPPTKTEICRFEVQIGCCRGCRRRVQPATPSRPRRRWARPGCRSAPGAVALAAWCNKELGLPAGKVARLLGQFGLDLTPGE